MVEQMMTLMIDDFNSCMHISVVARCWAVSIALCLSNIEIEQATGWTCHRSSTLFIQLRTDILNPPFGRLLLGKGLLY